MADALLTRPSTRRIVLVGVALPAAIVVLDYVAWTANGSMHVSQLFLPWLVVKAAILSWCAGRFLGASVYGWIIFLWCQALLDVQTFGASQGVLGYRLTALTHALVSAQIGFLLVWTVVGDAKLPWRITS